MTATAMREGAEVDPDTDVVDGRSSTSGTGAIRWNGVLAYGVLPALVLLLALGAGYAKWLHGSTHSSPSATIDSMQAATEGTVAMLSYQHDTVEQNLTAASDRLTGDFKGTYTALINDVVIPGAKQQKISATVSVPAAAPVSVSENHSVVMVFVNQATTIGDDPPTNTTSSVRVTLEKADDRWLITNFESI